MIGLNVMALTRMTRIVLDQWEENNEKGDIVNITSYAGVNPAGDPLYAVYSGTKAYVQFFHARYTMNLGPRALTWNAMFHTL